MQWNGRMACLIGGALVSASIGPAPAAMARSAVIARAMLLDGKGAPSGEATLTDRGGALTVKLSVHGLPPGRHGVHLHTVGSCNAPDFTSAGGHLNPQGRMHGSLNPQGSHLGDLPNLAVGRGGSGTLTVKLAGSRDEIWPALFDGDGTALVVHASPDDYRTDPSGNSGARIACGVLTRVR